MKTQEKKHTIGQLKTIEMNIIQPIEMNFGKIQMNQLNLYVGQNGSGKSLILKNQWLLGMIAQYYIVSLTNNNVNIEKEISYLFDKTFDANNFTGEIIGEFDNLYLSFKMDNGKCISFNANTNKELELGNPPIFMSKDMRTISDMVKYLKTKKMLKINSMTQEGIDKILEMYKIYDYAFAEMFLLKINGYQCKQDVKDALKSFDLKFTLDNIYVDEIGCTIKSVDSVTNKVIDLSILSAGEQSLIVMILGTIILK